MDKKKLTEEHGNMEEAVKKFKAACAHPAEKIDPQTLRTAATLVIQAGMRAIREATGRGVKVVDEDTIVPEPMPTPLAYDAGRTGEKKTVVDKPAGGVG